MNLRVERIEAHVFRVPIDRPVATSFGVMRDRPAVFVRLEDEDGAFGWGEVFANWPAAGAEHRARLLMEDMADLVLGQSYAGPQAMFATLTAETRIRAIQCAEPGPFAQVIAGLDTAAHDLAARRTGLPLARFLAEGAASAVPCYASGIAAAHADQEVDRARTDGHTAFKVKIGFDAERDLAALSGIAGGLAREDRLMCDANQAWTFEQAVGFCQGARSLPLGWLEEPLVADAPLDDWVALAAKAPPLAAGENLAGQRAFDDAIASGAFAVLQPDLAKWGGITGCSTVAQGIREAGLRYCPHFLGGGIGLLASAHLLAAADADGAGEGLLEVDVNPNPLRDAFEDTRPQNGHLRLSSSHGLGVEALPDRILPYRTLELARSAG